MQFTLLCVFLLQVPFGMPEEPKMRKACICSKHFKEEDFLRNIAGGGAGCSKTWLYLQCLHFQSPLPKKREPPKVSLPVQLQLTAFLTSNTYMLRCSETWQTPLAHYFALNLKVQGLQNSQPACTTSFCQSCYRNPPTRNCLLISVFFW